MKPRALLAGLLASLWATIALAGPISGYPAASALTGTEKIIATQAGATVNITPNQIATFIAAGNVATATKLATPRTLAITGDLAWTTSFDGSADVTAAGTLPTVNANVGSFTLASITVDGKGRVTAASNGGSGAVTSFNGRVGAVVPASADYTAAQVTGAAPLASPTFTGTPAAPTAAGGTNTTQLATTAFVNGASITGSAATLTTGRTLALTGDVTYTSPSFNGSANVTAAATLATAQPAVHTWALAQTFTVAPVFTDQSGSRTALGLGTSATVNTGTSGATIPLLNGANTWSGAQVFSTANDQAEINGAAATARLVYFNTAGVHRWDLAASAAAESGANAGTNFVLDRYSDAGSFVDSPISVNRVNGVVGFGDGFAMTGSSNLMCSATAPTISSGFGTSPTIVAHNGTCAFQVNVGTGGSATSGVIGLPAATTGWVCSVSDITTESTTVFFTKQTASTTTSATVGNFNTSAAAAAWVASDKLNISCHGY